MTTPTAPHRYVVTGGGNGSGNHGDEIMWLATVDSLRQADPGCLITTGASDGWANPMSVQVLPLVHQSIRRMAKRPRTRAHTALQLVLNRRSLDRGLRRCRELQNGARPKTGLEAAWDEEIRMARAVIFAGAGGLTDANALHAVAGWGMLAALANRHEVPVAFLGHGIGPIQDPAIRSCVTRILEGVSLITTRDPLSAELVRELNPGLDVEATPDWAILAEPTEADREEAASVVDKLVGRLPYIVLSLRSYGGGRLVEDVVKEVVQIASDVGCEVLLVPTCVARRRASDIVTMAEMVERLEPRARSICHPVESRLQPRVVRSIIGASAGVFANRYHALVFALAGGAPATGIAVDEYYRQKMSGALGWYDLDHRIITSSPVDRGFLSEGFDIDGSHRTRWRSRTLELQQLTEAPFLAWMESLA